MNETTTNRRVDLDASLEAIDAAGLKVRTADGIECLVRAGRTRGLVGSFLVLEPTERGRASDAYLVGKRDLGDDYTLHPEIGSTLNMEIWALAEARGLIRYRAEA